MLAARRRPANTTLETLLEDAFVMHDRSALVSLFEPEAVLASGDGAPVARGSLHIVQAAAAMWAREEHYLADPLRVLQARRTALIAGRHATTVARRSSDGGWRYAIALLYTQPQP